MIYRYLVEADVPLALIPDTTTLHTPALRPMGNGWPAIDYNGHTLTGNTPIGTATLTCYRLRLPPTPMPILTTT